MKITDVKPLIARGAVRNMMIVKVETDAGYYGWGESGLGRAGAGRQGSRPALPRVPGREGPAEDWRALAGDVPEPVFRRRPRAHGGHLGDRPGAARRGRAQPGRARLPAPRRGTARLGAMLHDLARGNGSGGGRGRQDGSWQTAGPPSGSRSAFPTREETPLSSSPASL